MKHKEELTWKIDLSAKCPYCNKEDVYVFYLNAEELSCNFCNKEFNIKIFANNIIVETEKK